MDGFPSFTNVPDSRAKIFFLCDLEVASAEVDSWKVKLTLVQGILHSKYCTHVLMKALKTHRKFQKNMDMCYENPWRKSLTCRSQEFILIPLKSYTHLLSSKYIVTVGS